MDTLLTFVGNHDPFTSSAVTSEKLDGPILTLAKHHRFDNVVLLATPQMKELADQTATTLRAWPSAPKVVIVEAKLADPTNHIEILGFLRGVYQEQIAASGEHSLYVAVASGTPAMHACWLLLLASGEIPAQLVQMRPPRYVTTEQPPLSVIDLTHAAFPRVTAKLERPSLPAGTSASLQAALAEIGIVGAAPTLIKVLETAAKAAPHMLSVLIQGERGTGKEQIAHLVHRMSQRRGRFVAFNCNAVPETLAESELFGHVAGAFYGAERERLGLFREADKGTLFIDEIGDMSVAIQPKFLRALQEKSIRPVGSDKEVPVDVRIVAATNADLRAAAREKRFREELYDRINGVTLRLPPLRNRRDDIPALVAAFVEKSNLARKKTFTGNALKRLRTYHWPGNVRELQLLVERTLALVEKQVIDADDLIFEEPVPSDDNLGVLPEPCEGFDLDKYLSGVREKLKARALEITGGNQAQAARLLGISGTAMSKSKKKSGKA